MVRKRRGYSSYLPSIRKNRSPSDLTVDEAYCDIEKPIVDDAIECYDMFFIGVKKERGYEVTYFRRSSRKSRGKRGIQALLLLGTITSLAGIARLLLWYFL